MLPKFVIGQGIYFKLLFQQAGVCVIFLHLCLKCGKII